MILATIDFTGAPVSGTMHPAWKSPRALIRIYSYFALYKSGQHAYASLLATVQQPAGDAVGEASFGSTNELTNEYTAPGCKRD